MQKLFLARFLGIITVIYIMFLLLWIAGLSLTKFLKWGWIIASVKPTRVQMF